MRLLPNWILFMFSILDGRARFVVSALRFGGGLLASKTIHHVRDALFLARSEFSRMHAVV